MPIIKKPPAAAGMGTIKVVLPDAMKRFVDEQVVARGYGNGSEYIRDLIRRDQERVQAPKIP